MRNLIKASQYADWILNLLAERIMGLLGQLLLLFIGVSFKNVVLPRQMTDKEC